MLDFASRPPREFFPGMGRAVADRTIARLVERPLPSMQFRDVELPRNDAMALDDQVAAYARDNGIRITGYHVAKGDDLTVRITLYVSDILERETWSEIAERVSLGNCSLNPDDFSTEVIPMRDHMKNATILMSGRHLQHGDLDQRHRPGEVFTNCGHRDTEVMTLERGVVKLGEVVGETLTVRTSDGEWRPATFNEHGVQKLYELTFKGMNGRGDRVVKFTRNHRWLLEDGTVTDNIQIGDVLMPAPEHTMFDPEAVVHGLIFGDGTAHKGRRDHARAAVSGGRTYASIRVCKEDAVREEIHTILDDAGYGYTTPPHSNGDRVYYIGKLAYAKELPFTRDPDYIAGFIYGWWLADGHKTEHSGRTISTSSEMAAQWLKEHAVIAGQTVVSHSVKERKAGDGSYANGKALHCVRMRAETRFKLSSIEPAGIEAVFCPEEPVTSSFVMANGLLTGNCATAPTTFLSFYLLLNGAGVGRDYSDDIMAVDYADAPITVPVIGWAHPDTSNGMAAGYMTVEEAEHLYAGRKITVFEVPDSREGWAEAFALIETMAWEKRRDEVLILDFSKVRENGAPIKGMQNRPASGPSPMMSAIQNIAKLRDAGMQPWRSALYADHYCAAVVLVGGARRAARMSTKYWRDPDVLDFIRVKAGGTFLWSSNNSVTVDKDFWALVAHVVEREHDSSVSEFSDEAMHAYRVFNAVIEAAYHDGTGEPGFINVDKFDGRTDEIPAIPQNLINADRLKISDQAVKLVAEIAALGLESKYPMITNPCGEIQLVKWGGYCTIADVVPFHAESDDEAEDAFRTATRALIRTNLMSFIYDKEVKRTNRIGVGFTGIHEYALKRFGFGWRDLVNEKVSKEFWLTMARFSRAVKQEAKIYATKLGVEIPHTDTTVKPAGTTSKLFGLSEGAHLPAMLEYLRWVQFRNDDPLIEEYRAKGYPIKKLRTYSGTTVVGFPTVPAIVELAKSLGLESKLVTAAEATPEEQFEYLRLLEKYWIRGDLDRDTGNQVSYTLKYDASVVDFHSFKRVILDNQPTVKCVSVMPQTDTTAYEYQPEQPLTKAEFERVAAAIKEANVEESVDFEHLACENGACPVDFSKAGI